MSQRRGFRQMLMPTIIMGVFAVVLIILAYYKGEGAHMTGLKSGGIMLLEIAPLLIFAMIIAGTIPLLIPQETISQWIGVESGFKGILIGTVVGGFVPGGPYVVLPMAAGLLRVGAGTGTVVALLTGWALLGFTNLPLAIGIMGWKFMAIRIGCTFFFPPIAGLIANRFFGNVNLF